MYGYNIRGDWVKYKWGQFGEEHDFIFIDEAHFIKDDHFKKGPIAKLENNKVMLMDSTPYKTSSDNQNKPKNEEKQLSVWQSKVANEIQQKVKLIIEDMNTKDLNKIKNRISNVKKKINSNMTMKKKKKLKKKIDKLKRRLKKLKKKIDELKRKVK